MRRLLGKGATKVYINGPGHMTRMARITIYGKSLQKSSPELEILWSWNLVGSIRDSRSTKFFFYKVFMNDDPGLILTYLTALFNDTWGQIWLRVRLDWGELLQSLWNGEACSKGLNWLNNCVNFMKKINTQGGFLSLSQGCIHVYDLYFIYDLYFQTACSL